MLNDEQIQKVRQVLLMPGWNEVMRPAILNRGREAISALALSPDERKSQGGEFKDTDDVLLRAIIRDSQWMSVCWQNEITVYEHNRKLEELEQPNGANPQP